MDIYNPLANSVVRKLNTVYYLGKRRGISARFLGAKQVVAGTEAIRLPVNLFFEKALQHH